MAEKRSGRAYGESGGVRFPRAQLEGVIHYQGQALYIGEVGSSYDSYLIGDKERKGTRGVAVALSIKARGRGEGLCPSLVTEISEKRPTESPDSCA